MNRILGIVKIVIVTVGIIPAGLLSGYIETIILPIIVFIGLSAYLIKKDKEGLIKYNILAHIFSIITYMAMELIPTKSDNMHMNTDLTNVLWGSFFGLIATTFILIFIFKYFKDY